MCWSSSVEINTDLKKEIIHPAININKWNSKSSLKVKVSVCLYSRDEFRQQLHLGLQQEAPQHLHLYVHVFLWDLPAGSSSLTLTFWLLQVKFWGTCSWTCSVNPKCTRTPRWAPSSCTTTTTTPSSLWRSEWDPQVPAVKHKQENPMWDKRQLLVENVKLNLPAPVCVRWPFRSELIQLVTVTQKKAESSYRELIEQQIQMYQRR